MTERLIFLLMVVCVTTFGSAEAADAIKIADIDVLSGSGALPGQEAFKILRAASELVGTQGGVLGGRKFEIVGFDNKGSPQESLIVLKQAIDQGIRFVVSSQSSVTHALTDAIAKHNSRNPADAVLLLNRAALDPALTETKCNFWHFRFEPHTDTQVDVLTDIMAKQTTIHKVYLINQDYAFGQSVSRAAKEALARKRPDIQIVGDDLIPMLKVKDFGPYVAKIRASNADAVLTGNWGTDLSLLIKAANESRLPTEFFTLLGSTAGAPAAIGAAGADRVKSLSSWHINAADPTWERTLLEYSSRYGMTSDVAYLPPFRVITMLANAMNKASSVDPLQVARALEGAEYAGPTGESWMRAEDHQLIAPILVMSFGRAGQAPVKHDAEGTVYGWKTEALIPATAIIPPIKCKMERPG